MPLFYPRSTENGGRPSVARGGGIEPPFSGPKPDVLPLDDPRPRFCGRLRVYSSEKRPQSGWARRTHPATLTFAHGLVDQEAAQADAQEEAQEDAEGHPLAAASRQVVRLTERPRGAPFASRPLLPR